MALARKLLVALWRLAAHGVAPPGASQVDWQSKFTRRAGKPTVAAATPAPA